MKVEAARLLPFELAFRAPVVTAGSALERRGGTLLRLETDDGAVGWGEASPLASFGTESNAQCSSALERIAAALPGREVEACESWLSEVSEETPVAYAAVECALLDLMACARNQSQSQLLRGVSDGSRPKEVSIPLNALLLGDRLEDLVANAMARKEEGFGTFKLKVAAGGIDRDVMRVSAVRDALGSEAKIRLDANQGWSEDEASAAIERLAPFDLEYLEQPVVASDLGALARLREKSPVPIAADEAAVSEASARAVIEAGAADIIVIKPSAAGGARASLRIALAAKEKAIRVVVTSLLDSVIATTSAAHVAAVLCDDAEMPACGLATGDLFVRDLAVGPSIRRGSLVLPASVGLGVAPDPSQLGPPGGGRR